MLHIKLSDRQATEPSDLMRRHWFGYDPKRPADVLFEHNRGLWILGTRAEREDYAIFSYIGDHTVKFVAQIDGYERFGRKRAITGRVLKSDHPLADRWVGAAAPDHFRNPVTYFRDPEAAPQTCACGCGEGVPAKRAFVPGHDQKAIHERIGRGWGGTLGFIKWFDTTYPTNSVVRQPTDSK